MEQNSALWQNEIRANKGLVLADLLSFAVISVLLFLAEAEVFYVGKVEYRPIVLFALVLLLVTALIAWVFRFSKHWIKYMLLAVLTFTYAMMMALFTYYAMLLTVIPLVLSCRYYSKKLTIVVAVLTMFAFSAASIYGAAFGLLDLNFLELPQGTVIELKEDTWLSDAIERVSYDPKLMMKNMALYSLSIHLLLSVIIISICIRTSARGREIIYEQQALTEERMRAKEELHMAYSIQMNSLPKSLPAFPGREAFEIRAVMQPAKEVGGDFYDFFPIGEDKLAMVVADVSEKGVPAAMYMMTAKTMIKTHALIDHDPAGTLRAVNAQLAKDNEEDMFVTAWLGILDLTSGRLVYADAGHEKMLVRRGGTWELLPKAYKSMPLAMMEDEDLEDLPEINRYGNSELTLSPGDIICEYSDGLTEASTDAREMFGEERLLAACAGMAEEGPEEILQGVKTAIEDFVKGAPQYDDVTMMVMRYLGHDHD